MASIELGEKVHVVATQIVVDAAPIHVRVPLGADSSECNVWVTEEDCASNKTTTDTVNTSSSQEGDPVEVVVGPELADVLASTHDTLLLGGV